MPTSTAPIFRRPISKLVSEAALAFLSILVLSAAASACDLCSIYTSIEGRTPRAGSFQIGAAEQFTGFDDVRDNGRKVENTAHQHLESSVTQLFMDYDITDLFGVQVNIPYINRRFKRAEGGGVETGTEAGIGDTTLIGKYTPRFGDGIDYRTVTEFFAGIKLPTGDSDRLAEELNEEEGEEVEVPSAVHGHDLALGSGSYDVPLGFNLTAVRKRLLFTGHLHYTIRTKGDHDYRYSNDLSFAAAPGYYLALSHENTLALLAQLSGERKGRDVGHEGLANDTAVSALYLGPELKFTMGSGFSLDAGAEWPVLMNTSDFQATPSYRVHAGVTARF